MRSPRCMVAGLVIAVVAALFVSAAAGCGGGVGGRITDMVKDVPTDTSSFTYWDLETMLAHGELQPLYEAWTAGSGKCLDPFGIPAGDVKRFLEFTMYGNSTVVARGDIGLDSLRATLEGKSFENKDFRRVEVWQSPDGESWLAFLGETLIGGERQVVRGCIEAGQDEGSLYQDRDARDIMDRLPRGAVVRFARYQEPPYKGLVCGGLSLQREDSEVLKATLWYKFVGSGDAASGLQRLADDLDEQWLDRVDASQHGQFVRVTGVANIEDVPLQ